MSPLPSDYPRYAWQMLTGQRAAKEAETYAQRIRDLEPWLDLRQPRAILDVGNGSLRPQYALLRKANHQVTGIDYVNRPGKGWRRGAYQVLRRMFAAQLGLTQAAMAAQGLVGGDVTVLPFAAASFDLAVSQAAFEHFLDVPAVVQDLARVVRPGGMLWIGIHLFTSPSGGHNVSFTQYPLRTLPRGAEPWDHLRQRRRPFTVPLNQWRKHQYLEAFAQHFAILKAYCNLREGEQWLTPALEAELSAYTRDELTCATLVIVARK
ncbi:methyltransferase domain-containing protein [Candidatus Chloroploca sp. Khr17]|uniref:methyltransferase domain-containing protein n=1 Tax=Candidatus Chloroploca sp. Khr17 TaxID=2496869 RepID=UPI00101D136C|nr:methyltransferase domain-containing protein [Candidatus Chloroploca sp. Khr17]